MISKRKVCATSLLLLAAGTTLAAGSPGVGPSLKAFLKRWPRAAASRSKLFHQLTRALC